MTGHVTFPIMRAIIPGPTGYQSSDTPKRAGFFGFSNQGIGNI